ncbi:MAG TPA: hypothetical protein VI958_06105 [Acidobacteriota bacterium]
MLKVIFRAGLLVIAFFIALSIIKFLFFKLFFIALWVAAIAFLVYLVSAILKRA